jgi:cysteine desulfurase/selenocysteine lyase
LRRVGLEAIAQHQRRLTALGYEVLSSVPGIRILGPSAAQRAGILSFVLERIHAHDVAQRLDRQGIAVRAGHHCAMPLHQRLGVSASTRVSFYLYNTPAEVENLAPALEATRRFFRRA